MEFAGKVALITGGSLGIGRAIALELGRRGADVAFTYLGYRRHPGEADDVLGELRVCGGRGLAIEADAADFAASEAAVRAVTAKFGGLHLLVNNAGIARDATLWKMDEAQWDAVLAVNLKGCFNFIRTVSPLFRQQKAGRIVNITSINGLRGKFGQANYAASKAGIIGLTKSAARELGRYNVNVNAVAPGLIETDMAAELSAEARQTALNETVLGRLGCPEDVANAVLFLLSDAARHITGEVLRVDGGQYI